jgi:hypothetical protein
VAVVAEQAASVPEPKVSHASVRRATHIAHSMHRALGKHVQQGHAHVPAAQVTPAEELQVLVLTPDERLAKRAALPKHLRLGVTLAGMRELLDQMPSDALEQVNGNIPKDKVTGEPKFPDNLVFNGYANQYHVTLWEEGDQLTVCERLQRDKSPHVGEATVFVSWFLDTKIATLLDALAHFLESRRGCGRRIRSSGCATT